MSEWKSVTFESLSSSDHSSFAIGPFGSKVTTKDYTDQGVPFIRGVNLANGVFHDDDFVFISERKADEITPANVTPGDLVFTRKGTIGQVSMIPRNPRFSRYAISGSQIKARLNTDVAVPEFYYYWFNSPRGRQSILAHAVTTGVPSLANSLTTIKNLQVPLPSMGEQWGIATALGALDEKIAVNERILTVYEEILQIKFDHLTLVNGQEQAPEVSATKFVEFNPKTAKPAEEEAVYVDMAALPTDRAPITTWNHRQPKSGSRFINGDTLLARITPCLENGKTGYVDFMGDGQIGTGSTEFIVMRSRPGIPQEFSYFLARNKRFRSHAIQKMAGTSGRQRVSASDASNFFVRQPTDEELRSFSAESSKAFAHMKPLTAESRTLAELRDTLLPQLMSGKLRVKDAEKIVEDNV